MSSGTFLFASRSAEADRPCGSLLKAFRPVERRSRHLPVSRYSDIRAALDLTGGRIALRLRRASAKQTHQASRRLTPEARNHCIHELFQLLPSRQGRGSLTYPDLALAKIRVGAQPQFNGPPTYS